MEIIVVRDMRAAYGLARNQGIRPTCLAFAATDAHAAIRGPWMTLSSEYAFYHAQRRSKRSAHEGALLSTMLEVLREDGQPIESEWPYLTSLPPDLGSWLPPAGITKVYRRLSEGDAATMDRIVHLLDEGCSVLTILMLSDAFYLPGEDGIVDVVVGERPDPTRRHAVVAVGHGTRKGKRLILVRNSWGEEWGVGGYAWLTESFLRPRLMRIAVLTKEAYMYSGVPSQSSCAMAWLAATQCVDAAPGHEAHNVIVDVEDPTREDALDQKLVHEVDAFLRAHNLWPVQTVANTIFPQAVYELHGSPAFYDVYLTKVFPRIKRSHGDWGRYFERMVSFPKQKQDRKPLNPLQDLVTKMRENLEHDRTFKNIYELTIFDPVRDAGRPMNRQCLSFLSFKLTDDRCLILTAVYRNHYYIQRLLGNLIGLANLMSFVARETGATVGPLTIVSTHAEIDSAATRAEVESLIERCASACGNPAAART